MTEPTATVSPKKSFWDRVGGALALVAKGAAKGALWASQHPQVVAAIGAIAVGRGAPVGVINGIETGVSVAGALAGSVEGPQQ
jgi:hypothetical protein